MIRRPFVASLTLLTLAALPLTAVADDLPVSTIEIVDPETRDAYTDDASIGLVFDVLACNDNRYGPREAYYAWDVVDKDREVVCRGFGWTAAVEPLDCEAFVIEEAVDCDLGPGGYILVATIGPHFHRPPTDVDSVLFRVVAGRSRTSAQVR